FKIISKSKASHYVFKAITILNANGKAHGREIVGYDKLSKITSIKAAIYDANGILVKKLKSSEIYDQAGYDGFSLYSDNRLKALGMRYGSYPYTVEFEYEVEYKYLFFIPSFAVLEEEKSAAEQSEYSIIYPKELQPKYRTNNIVQKPVVTPLENNLESMSWNFNHVKPIKFEPYGGPWAEQVPIIYAAPSVFEFDGYGGKMDTWNEFGQWIHQLNKDRNILPEETKKKVVELTSPLAGKEEKIKAIYEYMQNK